MSRTDFAPRSLLLLPDNLLLTAFSYLDGPSLIRAGCVNRSLRELIISDELWRPMQEGKEWIFFPDGLNSIDSEVLDLGTARGRILNVVRGPIFRRTRTVFSKKVKRLKIYMAGWYGSGITTFCKLFSKEEAVNRDNIHTQANNLIEVHGTVLGCPVRVSLCDWYPITLDAADFEHYIMWYERVSWPGTNVCLLNFSVASARLEQDLHRLENYWMRGMRMQYPSVIFVLHGMQIDRREENGIKCMSWAEGMALGKRWGVPYVESSARTGAGVLRVVGVAVSLWLKSQKKKTLENCSIL